MSNDNDDRGFFERLFSTTPEDFEVHLDGVELQYPDSIRQGDDFQVRAAVTTDHGTNHYNIDIVQIWMDTDDGERLIGEGDYSDTPGLVGKQTEVTLSYDVDIDGDQIDELIEDGAISEGQEYSLKSHVITTEFERGRHDTYWSDLTDDGIRFDSR